MKIIFLGDVVGISGRSMVLSNLLSKIKNEKIDFVVVNGENAADAGVELQKRSVKIFLTVELMWLQLEIMFGIKKKPCPILKKKIDF